MKDYHFIWLSSHPDRTKQWLQDKLNEGFDIHHLDGDHFNNELTNLVLIEHVDHMRLHAMSGNRLKAIKVIISKKRLVAAGKVAYELHKVGKSWDEIKSFDKNYTKQNAELYVISLASKNEGRQ
jgi:hypothetical protein